MKTVRFGRAIVCVLLGFAGCGTSTQGSAPVLDDAALGHSCGDGLCTGPEAPANCPADCSTAPSPDGGAPPPDASSDAAVPCGTCTNGQTCGGGGINGVCGTTYYIAPTGSDSNAGSLSSPWLRWSVASTKLLPGDRLYARGGTYSGQFGYWGASGTDTAPITFAAYPGETPVFDGSDGAAASLGDFMIVQSKHSLIFDGLTIRNQNVTANIWLGYPGSGTDYTHHVTIRNCRFYDWGSRLKDDHAIYVSYGASDITINNNYMAGTVGAGVHLYHYPGGSNYHVFNNVVTGSFWGVIVDDAHDNALIEGNTFEGCTRTIQVSMYEGNPTHNTVLRDNVVYSLSGSSGEYALVVDPANLSEVHEDYNDWYDTTTSTPIQWGSTSYSVSGFRVTGNAAHSIQADPLFRTIGSDLRLQSGSPAINSGVPMPSAQFDFDGVGRPQGTGYDMGAFEYH